MTSMVADDDAGGSGGVSTRRDSGNVAAHSDDGLMKMRGDNKLHVDDNGNDDDDDEDGENEIVLLFQNTIGCSRNTGGGYAGTDVSMTACQRVLPLLLLPPPLIFPIGTQDAAAQRLRMRGTRWTWTN